MERLVLDACREGNLGGTLSFLDACDGGRDGGRDWGREGSGGGIVLVERDVPSDAVDSSDPLRGV